MNENIAKRIPAIPHWRWVLHTGDDHPDMCEELKQLQRYVEEEDKKIGLDIDEDDPNFKRAVKLKDQKPMREIVEKLLIEKCDFKEIVEIFYHKFKEKLDNSVVKYYRDFFFDVKTLNNYEVASYYQDQGIEHQFPHSPPPVPGEWRDKYTLHQNGGIVDIDPEEAMKFMFSDALFRAIEMNEYGWHGDHKKEKFSRLALDFYKAMQKHSEDSEFEMPKELETEVWYPDETAKDVDEIEDFDPKDDPNLENQDDE